MIAYIALALVILLAVLFMLGAAKVSGEAEREAEALRRVLLGQRTHARGPEADRG